MLQHFCGKRAANIRKRQPGTRRRLRYQGTWWHVGLGMTGMAWDGLGGFIGWKGINLYFDINTQYVHFDTLWLSILGFAKSRRLRGSSIFLWQPCNLYHFCQGTNIWDKLLRFFPSEEEGWIRRARGRQDESRSAFSFLLTTTSTSPLDCHGTTDSRLAASESSIKSLTCPEQMNRIKW